MKKLLIILTLTALAAIPTVSFGADAKKEAAAPAPKPAESKPVEGKGEKPQGGKTLPMNAKVDAIDAAAKTFSHNNKDGTVVKFMVTDTTEIKNGEADAKFEDIKVGDTVSGSRMKKSATEYEVVKISKFGVVASKEKKAANGDAKPVAPPKSDTPSKEAPAKADAKK